MSKQKNSIGVGLFDKENMTFKMGLDKTYTVQAKEERVRYKEREDAGGGCYYNNWVWSETTRTTYTVWDGDLFIGTIIPGSSVKFKDPKRHQISIPKP